MLIESLRREVETHEFEDYPPLFPAVDRDVEEDSISIYNPHILA